MIIWLSHQIVSYKSYRVRAPKILKQNKSHTNRITQNSIKKTGHPFLISLKEKPHEFFILRRRFTP